MATIPVVDDLARLVAFPTVSNRPNVELAAWLAERCEALGFRVERFPDPSDPGKCSLICTIGPASTDGLVLSGHMDVVPTEDQPWSSDPFRLTERDGLLFGRGTADMKGFFAAALQALARIPRDAWRRELALVWTHDEEVGCLGSQALVEAWDEVGRPLPTACLIGEPTGFEILRMHPGHVGVEIAITGRAAHSSRPDLGINAVEAAADAIRAVREVAAQLRAERRSDLPELERPWVAVNTATIRGGTAINIVPDRAVVTLGYRPLPGDDPAEVFHRIRAAVDALDLDARAEVARLRVTPAMLTPAGTPLEALLRPHASRPGCGAATFATDGGNLARLGLRPLVFGPGSIEVAHQADEYVPARDLLRAVDVLEAVVRRRCATDA